METEHEDETPYGREIIKKSSISVAAVEESSLVEPGEKNEFAPGPSTNVSHSNNKTSSSFFTDEGDENMEVLNLPKKRVNRNNKKYST